MRFDGMELITIKVGKNMKDRLYDLFANVKCPVVFIDNAQLDRTINYLLENGVIVPPCKVGDMVWELCKCDDDIYRIFPMTIALINVYGAFRWDRKEQPNVWNIYATADYTYMYKRFSDIGETLFLTKAEAEQALAERQTNND